MRKKIDLVKKKNMEKIKVVFKINKLQIILNFSVNMIKVITICFKDITKKKEHTGWYIKIFKEKYPVTNNKNLK